MSILWMTNPLDLQEKLPLRIPDYDGWLEKRIKRLPSFLLPGEQGERNRRAEYMLCKNDILHWIKYWCWLYNPWKPPEKQEFPFIPYEFQEELILYLRDAIVRCNDPDTFDRENDVIEKCREMAGSWSVYITALHDFLFYNGSYLILSWKREEVDEPGNMDTPFEKLRFLLRRLPEWQRPAGWNWRDHSNVGLLKNPCGGSIGSESMTAAAGAGGRVRAVIFDEFGKIQDGTDYPAWRSTSGTSRLRIAISTPEGRNNKFGRLATGDEQEERVLISLNWWKDPVKSQGLTFINGKPTSRWYEEQKAKLDPITLASQVDISYDNSVGGKIFGDLYSEWHQVRDGSLSPVIGQPILICFDPGVHFFVSFTQFDHHDRYLVLDELYFANADIDSVAEAIQRKQRQRFRDYKFEYIGDPAGGSVNTSMHRLKSEYLYLLETYGWQIEYNFQGANRAEWVDNRNAALKRYLTRHCPTLSTAVAPSPMVLVDVRQCKHIHDALSGGYRYKSDYSGQLSHRIDARHPHEDAADCTTYPLMYKGMYAHRKEKKERRERTGFLNWQDVGDRTYG
jgi:hypothetical protein